MCRLHRSGDARLGDCRGDRPWLCIAQRRWCSLRQRRRRRRRGLSNIRFEQVDNGRFGGVRDVLAQNDRRCRGLRKEKPGVVRGDPGPRGNVQLVERASPSKEAFISRCTSLIRTTVESRSEGLQRHSDAATRQQETKKGRETKVKMEHILQHVTAIEELSLGGRVLVRVAAAEAAPGEGIGAHRDLVEDAELPLARPCNCTERDQHAESHIVRIGKTSAIAWCASYLHSARFDCRSLVRSAGATSVIASTTTTSVLHRNGRCPELNRAP